MGLTYLALGDSISTILAEGKNFPWLIRDYIQENHTPIKYINKAIGGITTQNIVDDISSYCNIDADIVTICIGVNDASTYDTVISLDDYEDNLQYIIDYLKLRNQDVKILLCTPFGNNDIIPYANKMITVANNNYNCDICRFDEILPQSVLVNYDNDDGTHPNEGGHLLMVEQLKPIIDEILS